MGEPTNETLIFSAKQLYKQAHQMSDSPFIKTWRRAIYVFSFQFKNMAEDQRDKTRYKMIKIGQPPQTRASMLTANDRVAALIVGHVAWRGRELGVGFDHLVDSLQEIFLAGNFSSGSDGKHTCLCAHRPDLSTWEWIEK